MLPVIYTDRFLAHQTGFAHPERPARLSAVVQRLRNSPVSKQIDWQEPYAATREQLLWIHTPQLIDSVEQMASRGGGMLDADTPVGPESFEVACLAAGSWLAGVDAVLERGRPAWVVARPPGHHAERNRAMGFCLFSNAALAAHYALNKGLSRVAVLDWDVHHGNGTQQLCWDDPRLAYVSLHQFPHYPGTGSAGETGAHGNVCNVPLESGSDGTVYREAFKQTVWPFIDRFSPELLIVSAGFDANRDDPLSEMGLVPGDYGDFAHQCLARTPRVLFGLEGGYDLDSLADSVLAVVEACLTVSA